MFESFKTTWGIESKTNSNSFMCMFKSSKNVNITLFTIDCSVLSMKCDSWFSTEIFESRTPSSQLTMSYHLIVILFNSDIQIHFQNTISKQFIKQINGSDCSVNSKYKLSNCLYHMYVRVIWNGVHSPSKCICSMNCILPNHNCVCIKKMLCIVH